MQGMLSEIDTVPRQVRLRSINHEWTAGLLEQQHDAAAANGEIQDVKEF
jgi:hypothetical protein